MCVHDACVHYDATIALAPSSFELAAGTSVALVGANGSGKTTLLSLIGCMVRATSGRIRRCRRFPLGRTGWCSRSPRVR